MPLAGHDRLPSILGLIALATLIAALVVRPHALPPGSAAFPTVEQGAPAPRRSAPGVPMVGQSYAIDAISSGEVSGTPAAPVAVRPGADVHVSGWAVDPRTLDPIGHLVIRIDGVVRSDVLCKGERPDVAAVLGVPSAASSGFDTSVPTIGLRDGRHTLSFLAVARDRRAFALPTQATIVIGP